MIVVADTGPIIALATLDRIDLLGVFGADILVPPRVRRELLSKPESETREIEQALGSLIQVREVPPLGATTKDAVDRLDPGERDALVWFQAIPFCTEVILSVALEANATEYSWGAKRSRRISLNPAEALNSERFFGRLLAPSE